MYTGKPKDFDYVKMREGSKKVGVKVSFLLVFC